VPKILRFNPRTSHLIWQTFKQLKVAQEKWEVLHTIIPLYKVKLFKLSPTQREMQQLLVPTDKILRLQAHCLRKELNLRRASNDQRIRLITIWQVLKEKDSFISPRRHYKTKQNTFLRRTLTESQAMVEIRQTEWSKAKVQLWLMITLKIKLSIKRS
jgi:hypothetical protein